MALVDTFLKLEGIDGESADDKHKAWIDVVSWSFGATQTGTHHLGGGGGAGKVAVQDLHVVTQLNKASPKLFLNCATGEHIKKGVLTCRKAGGTQNEYLTYTLTDVLVSSYQTGHSGASDAIHHDQISLNFGKIEMEYKEQKADGTMAGGIKAGYDIKANKKV